MLVVFCLAINLKETLIDSTGGVTTLDFWPFVLKIRGTSLKIHILLNTFIHCKHKTDFVKNNLVPCSA